MADSAPLNVRRELAVRLRDGRLFLALQQLVFWVVTLKALQRFYYNWRYRTLGEIVSLSKAAVLRNIFKFLRTVSPRVRRTVADQVAASVRNIEKGLIKIAPGERVYDALPAEGLSVEEVKAEIQRYKGKDDTEYLKGRVSGAVYHASEEILEVATAATTTFASANPLHPDIFQSTRQMEAEIIAMVLKMYNAPPTAGGVVTSGGTESLLMTCKAHRDWAYKTRGVTEPEIVVPNTIHAAFDKAASYFKIKLRKIPVNPVTLQADIERMDRAVNANTIMVACSAPNYPHGIVDDVAALGKVALKHGIGFHVDCCLGGFIMPFMHDAGFPMAPFDFRVRGVTSISCDSHKYGFAVKGTSILMFVSNEYRHPMYSIAADWPGGMYASHAVAGSRIGSVIAGCWAAMIKMGHKGYVGTTREIVSAARKLKDCINSIPELELMGDPFTSVIAWTSSRAHPSINIYAVADCLGKRGWHVNSLQNPPGLHVAVTLLGAQAIDDLVADLRAAVEEVKRDPEGTKGASVAVYGTSASVAGTGVIDEVLEGYLDAVVSLKRPE
ncbi:sphinganine-1-phosphate aldolase [Hyaloraphidium curvatum]|nr:sphinganine-1-phosphate aldolase [Hyaloraphidium curvatum]